MTERETQSYPTNHVSRDDVLSIRPDLDSSAEALTEDEIEAIADIVGERLQETYWLALEIVLDHRHPITKPEE